MEALINPKYLVNSILFSIMGRVIFGRCFYIFDRLTPTDLWKEITEKNNVSLAIVVGAVSIGICMIIASAIHG